MNKRTLEEFRAELASKSVLLCAEAFTRHETPVFWPDLIAAVGRGNADAAEELLRGVGAWQDDFELDHPLARCSAALGAVSAVFEVWDNPDRFLVLRHPLLWLSQYSWTVNRFVGWLLDHRRPRRSRTT